MKRVGAVLLASSFALLCACGGNGDDTKTLTNLHGEEFKVKDGVVSVESQGADKEYTPYTITLNLERSGLGQNIEETFTKAPTKVIASGDQMADFFFDLGLENNMAGYTRGSCWSTVNDFPARNKVKLLAPDGVQLETVGKEVILDTGCDFMMGWDSLFSEKNFPVTFCLDNGIIPYFPYCCSDQATFEDVYKDYETLGSIFNVKDVAQNRIDAMKATLENVKKTLGEKVYEKPLRVFVYDSGEDVPFTACQGIPGDIIKKAGGISIFDDIPKGWAKPAWEEVVARDPDVILILDYDNDTAKKTEFLKTSPFTKDLRAVKEGKIYSACCADMQGSAGSAKAVEIIAKQLYPNLF